MRSWVRCVVVAVLLWLVQAVPPVIVALATGDDTYGGPLALAGILLRTPSWILACVAFAGAWTGTPTLRPAARALTALAAYLVVGVALDGLVWGVSADFAAYEATWVAFRGGQLGSGAAVAALLAATAHRARTPVRDTGISPDR